MSASVRAGGKVYIIPGHLHAVYDRHFEGIMSNMALCGSENPSGVGASYARYHSPEQLLSLVSRPVAEQRGKAHAAVAPAFVEG
jgi:hypothetical protein